VIVPHGSYVGFYPPGRDRSLVRAELGISDDSFVFLCFGELRGYKDVDLLLDAYAEEPNPQTALVVAGHPKIREIGERVAAAARADARVKPVLRFVGEDQVGELFGAADAAVVARGDGGTSGSLVLALSMGLPVVVADRPAYRALVRAGEAGWLFQSGDRDSLRCALLQASSGRDAARERGIAARRIAESLQWPEIAADVAQLLQALVR
jgi:glycosyltransferase involved in cell wall biosynthesis